jgi:hypothetical protein
METSIFRDLLLLSPSSDSYSKILEELLLSPFSSSAVPIVSNSVGIEKEEKLENGESSVFKPPPYPYLSNSSQTPPILQFFIYYFLLEIHRERTTTKCHQKCIELLSSMENVSSQNNSVDLLASSYSECWNDNNRDSKLLSVLLRKCALLLHSLSLYSSHFEKWYLLEVGFFFYVVNLIFI